MEGVRSERSMEKLPPLQGQAIQRTRLKVWFFRVCSTIVIWTCLVQLVAVAELWHPRLLTGFIGFGKMSVHDGGSLPPSPPPLVPASHTADLIIRVYAFVWLCIVTWKAFWYGPFKFLLNSVWTLWKRDMSEGKELASEGKIYSLVYEAPKKFVALRRLINNNFVGNYRSNGFLKVSCNGGLNQMRSAICDMVTISRLLNLTLVVPELDKTSFWADPSDFEDIFDVGHFINSLRDEVRIIKRLPKRVSPRYGYQPLEMPPISWSNEQYYLQQILPLFDKHKVIHFNRTDTRLANNGIPFELQKLRCRVNFHALKFTPEIEAIGNKLIRIIQQKGPYLALHLRYEMDMLAFSGCTHGCTEQEAEELKQMRYAFPWWKEKEIVSEERRHQGLCPLTPEEMALILQALDFDKDTQIYIAAGEIYGGERRLATLRDAFPRTVKKETLLDPEDMQKFQNHSSQMAALDFMVSVASDVFVPTYDGNMARVVEGHRRYLGYKKTFQLDRRKLVQLLDLHENGTLSWNEFSSAVKLAHETRMGQPRERMVIIDKPKEEDYFYANPQECLCVGTRCGSTPAIE